MSDGLLSRRLGAGRFRLAIVLALGAAAGPLAVPATAQVGDRSTPSLAYFNASSFFYEGEYREALDIYADQARGAIKTPQSRWIDSICYETMVAECYYEMGNLGKALDHYTAALKLFVAFNDWMIRVQFPPMVRPASAGAYVAIPWGTSSRRARLGQYPAEMLMSQGRINNNEQIQRGGVVSQPVLFPINVQEIVRCTTLAIRRRTELLGPVCQHDPLTGEALAALAQRPGPPNHWSEAWIDVQLGLAYVAAGREAQGIDCLKRSLVVAGEFDHPMTGVALLELGKLAMAGGEYPAAAKYFLEATYPAAYYGDLGALEEAFRYGAITHLMANQPGVYPPLAAAIEWAKRKGYRQLHASLVLLAAENHAVLGQVPAAARLLDDARAVIGRREMGGGRIGARLSFLTALVLFQQKKMVEGDAALASAMGFMRQGSFWLFHIALADNLFTSGAMTPRVAMDLYQSLLRDPGAPDWHRDPMESLAVLVTPHPAAFEHWFEVALMRKEHESALEIADLARRHRFYSSMPFGGRLLSLRWILEGPPDMLDREAQLHRQDLLARYPAYAQLQQQSGAVRARLAALPLAPAQQDLAQQQGEALAQLAAVSLQQEALLREMAVRREPAGLVFPPVRSTKQIQEAMPDGHALLAFFATSRQLYGFLLNKERYTYWQVASPAALQRQIVALLRDLDQHAPNYDVNLKDIADTSWKKSAAAVLDSLLQGSRADFSQKFDELVIVPDGLLWYVPFEALQVDVGGQPRPLISRFRIRYAPTASLAYAGGRAHKPLGNTAVVVGRLYPQDADAVAQAAFDKMARVVTGAVALNSAPPAPSSVYASLFDRLVVLDDLIDTGGAPYGWAPAALDRGKAGSVLADWICLPWGGPDEVILPGYHTATENGIKGVNPMAGGQEVFLSVCGLMATGTRTIVLSRWRTGGQTAFDFAREFVQELPHTTPADAFQRAVFVVAGSRLALDAEPRVQKVVTDEMPKAGHPFFWAPYMLIDPGTLPTPPDRKPDEPVIKVVPPDGAEAAPPEKPGGA